MQFDVLFLDGLNLLSPVYRDQLTSLGYRLHDLQVCFRQVEKRFPSIKRFGDYEEKCFLRWLVIQEIHGSGPFVHYDADIVFNATPEAIEAEFAGLTFMLQGCPAYTRVDDGSWLQTYEEELKRFHADIESYSAEAWRQRVQFEPHIKQRNGALWNRNVLSSDQDLLQFLNLSGRLPQADAETVNRATSMALFQNPLTIGSDIHLSRPLQYERRAGIDYIGGRRVAFWHMQGDFCHYLGYTAFRRSAKLNRRSLRIGSGQPFAQLAYTAVRRLTGVYDRNSLIHRYFGEGSEDLGFILNNNNFWERGVFV